MAAADRRRGSVYALSVRVSAVRRGVWSAVMDLADTQTYSHACSIAFNAILAFFPFTVLLLMVCKNALHWPDGADAILLTMRDEYLPTGGDTIVNALRSAAAHTPTAVLSGAWLAFSSAGLFGPVELALNQAWGVHAQRPWPLRRALALALVLMCGLLAMGSIYLAGASHLYVRGWVGALRADRYTDAAFVVVTKLLAFLAAALMFFVVYVALPYRRIPLGRVLRAALFVSLLWELSKYVFVWVLPRLEYQQFYGPFYVAMALVLWALISSLLFLLGANLSARWPE